MTSIGRERARNLRRDPTEAEKRLWSRLRRRQLAGYRFRRQVPIGPYFADFASHEAKLIVEVDGGQHATNADADYRRTRRMEADGYRVIRFWNNEVLENTDGVVQAIHEALLESEFRKAQ
jgi:adenine-specific DNA-methyltransferase